MAKRSHWTCPPALRDWRTYAGGTYCREGVRSYDWTDIGGGKWSIDPSCRGANRRPVGYTLRGPNGVVARGVRTPAMAAKIARETCDFGRGLGRARCRPCAKKRRR